jgi:hypothetical protein
MARPYNRSLEPLYNLISIVAGYTASDQDTADGVTTYFGFLDKEGSWYIQQQVTSGVDPAANITWRYARGDGAYASAWAGRGGLTYALFNEVF